MTATTEKVACDPQATTAWAVFSDRNHAVRSGWATYMKRPYLRRWRLRCRLGHHAKPVRSLGPYGRCSRCGAALKWFVVGQHRFGGYDAPLKNGRKGAPR